MAGIRRLAELARQGKLHALPATASGITRDIGSIAVIEHDGSNYDMEEPGGVPNYAARVPVAQRFYETHGDNYDFLVVFTNFTFEMPGADAVYYLVRNDVHGIGRVVADNGAFFGSPGRLKGYIDMSWVDRWRQAPYSVRPGDLGFSRPLNVLAHEVGHQWLAGAHYLDESAQPSSALATSGSHWSYLLDSDASVLLGADWTPNPEGAWTAARVFEAYSPLDRYLMGFLPPAQVPPFTLLHNPAIDPTRLAREGDTVAAERAETVAVGQVIAAEGPRSPGFEASQKDFRIGVVFLTRPGTEPSPEDLEAVENVRQAFTAHFFAMTHGVGFVDTSLAETPRPPGPGAPDLDRAQSWLLAQQRLDGSWADAATTAVRDTATAVEALLQSGPGNPAIARGLSWLAGTEPRSTDFAARQHLVLGPGSADRRRRAADLLARQAADGGFGAGNDYSSDPLDTALVLRALKALDHPADTAARRALLTLGALRAAGGGWPVVPGGDPSTLVTAHVLLALQDWKDVAEAQAALGPGLASLLSRRNPDGGFGESPSTPYASAIALQVLLRAAAPPVIVDGAVAWLKEAQLENGSWNDSPFETALVLSALRNGLAPNLVVPADRLALSPPRATEGETVHVSATIRNAGRTPAPESQARLFDGDPAHGSAVAEAAVPPLGAGEEAAVSFEFPTSDRPGVRTLFVVADADGRIAEAREDDNTASRALTVEGLLPDLVVRRADVSVTPYPPESGETVQVAVTVTNHGQRAAAASLVQVTLGNPREGGSLIATATLPSLGIGQSTTLILPWNTTGVAAGEWLLFAAADARFAVAEADETNNEAALPVQVTEAASDGPDFAVATLTLDPATQSLVPQPLQAVVLVRNLGRAPGASTLALFDERAEGRLRLAERTVELGPRAAATLVIPLTVEGRGPHTLLAVADPEETQPDANRSNNTARAVLPDPHNTIDLELRPQDVEPSAADLVVGEPLTVAVTVRNRGTQDVPEVPVQLALADGSELARTSVAVGAGGVAAASLSWTTGLTGDPLALVVRVDPFETLVELSEANNEVRFDVRVRPSALANLAIHAADVAFNPDPPLEGQTATISATVHNPSAVAAGPFAVRFFLGDPDLGGSLIGEAAVAGLEGTASTVAAVTWFPVRARGSSGVTVVLDPLDAVPEFDETDNRTLRLFQALGLPDLVLAAGDVVLDPGYPRAGQAVDVRATVRNLGAQASDATTVRVFEGEPGSGAAVAELPVPALSPGQSHEASFSWTPAAPPGGRTLSLVADPDDLVHEQDEGNGVVRRSVVVQNADLFLTEPFFSPDGDGVKDETVLGYRATGSVTVVVSDERGQAVRTLLTDGPPSGSVAWDGRDERGLLLRDGSYTLSVLGQGREALGRTRAVIDTNRSPIHDAAGTGRAVVRNVTCGLPEGLVDAPYTWMPGEQDLLLIVGQAYPGWPVGLLRVPLDGPPSYVSQDPWFAGASFGAVSPDGREVLIYRDGFHAYDLLTGEHRASPGGVWSPNGRFILSGRTVWTREGEQVGTLPVVGAGAFPYGWSWSPDSERLAKGNVIVARDGTILETIEMDAYDEAGETIWRGDGKIFTRLGAGCDDGCRSERAYVLDPESGAVAPLPWLDLPGGELSWSPDGSKVALAGTVYREDGSLPLPLLAGSVPTVSPRASAASYVKWSQDDDTPGGVCLGKTHDVFVVQNAQNLVADLRAERLPGNNGLLLKGTASDRYLGRFQIDFARSEEPEAWRPIGAASEIPVVDDLLVAWVPPGPGTYLARLRAEDAAGNASARTIVVAWDRLPIFANLTQSEFIISPNDDGVKDAVTFNYFVLDTPAHLEVRVAGPEIPGPGIAPIVRAFAFDYGSLGAQSFTWDGRDESGRFVPDGRYTVLVNDIPLRVEVDATPPEVAFRYENLGTETIRIRDSACLTLRVGASVSVDRLWHVVDPHLKRWEAAGQAVGVWESGRQPVYEFATDAAGVTILDGGIPRVLRVDGRPVDRRMSDDPRGASRDSTLRFVAEDHAGNRSVLPVAPPEERIFVLHARRGCDPPIMLPPLEDKVYGLPPSGLELNFAHTLRTPREAHHLRFQYRPRESAGPWLEIDPHSESAWNPDFAAHGLDPAIEYLGRYAGNGETGEVVSETFRFRACDRFLELAQTRGAPTPEDEALERAGLVRLTFGLIAEVPQPLASADLVLGDQRFPMQVGASGAFIGSLVTRIPTCSNPVVIGAEALGVDGVIYKEDDPARRGCLRLSVAVPACGLSLQIRQKQQACATASADQILLKVSATASNPGHALLEGGPSANPFPIASLEIPATLPGDVFTTTLAVDVTGRAEGALPVRGSLTSPQIPAYVARAETAAYIDRSPPTAEILQPAEGAPLCLGRDDGDREVLTVVASTADFAPELEVSGEMRKDDGPWQPLQRSCPEGGCVPETLPGTAIHTLSWRAGALASGEYTVRLTFCDRAGNRSTAERRVLLTRDPPTATLASQSQPVFSPNGDGRADITSASFRAFTGLLLEGSVHVGSASGPRVRALGTSLGASGSDVAFTWDGRDDQGALAPDGRYVIRVRVRDGCGGSSDTSATVEVDRTPPLVAISLPLPGQSVPSSLDVAGSATDTNFKAYELSYGVGDEPAAWLPVSAGTYGVPGGFLGRWDPPGSPGHYTLRLRATDRAENEAEPYRVTVDVNPGRFLGRLAATPALFSPNGDGRRETTTLEYELKIDAQVSLEVRDARGLVLRRFESAAAKTAGVYAFVWDGRTDAGAPAPEGDHVVWVRAADGVGASQEHAVRVSIDRTPPLLLLERPTPGSFLPRQAAVHGSVTDPNLTGYAFQAIAPGGAVVDLAQGTEPRPGADLASLAGLDEAPYLLLATATDAAENIQRLEVPFVVDSLPPVVRLLTPPDGAVLRRTESPVLVTGRAEDANLESATLRFGAGHSPIAFIEIPATTADGLVGGSWSVASLPDGPYTLSLRATDRAGQASEARRLVSVDSTAPAAAIRSPAEGAFVVKDGPINGTATDANLASWTLEGAPGAAGAAYRWSELGRGASPVEDDLLVHWMPLPPDGTHTLRLTVRDQAGLVSTALRTVTVDTTPPAAPTGLAATVERNGAAGDVRLTWNANPEPDLAGYRVFRDGASLDPSLLTEPRKTDAARPEGRYPYRVVAVDGAGNLSAPAALTVSVDLTPPAVDLTAPAEGAAVSGSVDVRGTAFSADDFKEYRLLVGQGTEPATWTELRRSTLPVVAGTLGSWTGILDGPHTLALEAEDTSGNRARVTRVVVVDTQPPLAPTLTALAPSAADALNATWQASPSADVAGYLVYRNGRIANAPAVVLGDLGGYLVPGPTYVDLALPDGRHCYRVVARDQAGNPSPPSNELCHSLDNRPPRATILQPADGARFGFPVRVVADTPDTDVVSLQFQIRPSGEPGWAALNAPLARPPFETTLDPAALTAGAYELRALARDEGGREDPAPPAILVHYGDVTAPAPPRGLSALTDGADVRLTWTASPEADLASYRVRRDGELAAADVTEPTFRETGLGLARYEYTVTALDHDGNESQPSNPAEAVVYRLRLEPPAWPVTSGTSASLAGAGARAGTTVRILREELLVGAAPSAGGNFRVDGVALAAEGNVLRARGEDASGNRSLPSDEVVVISNAPPAGVAGLTAEVNGHAVSLAWGPVADPDVFGYLVRRDGQRLTPSSRRTEAAEVVPPDASAAFDGNPATWWRPASAPATWSVRIPEPGLVERVHLRFAQGEAPVAAYQVFARWEGRLVPLVRVEHNLETVADHVFPMPFATDTIAIELGSAGALAEVEIYAVDVVSTSTTVFREEDVADGAHTYRVSAIDRYGAEGPAAEAAAPVGDLLPPGPPIGLTVTVASRDAALAWTSNPEADLDHYVVLRDQVRIATTLVPAYADPGLLPGTYVYTVLAVDGGGNESAPSDPATAFVAAAAPAAPVILVPTDAAHPLALEAVATDVAGRTDPDTIVELEVNGESRGFTEAHPTWFPTAGPSVTFGGGIAASPDGRWLAAEDPGGGVRLHDLSSGSDEAYAPAGYGQFPVLRFSPDSGRLALLAQPVASDPAAVILLDLASRDAVVAYSGPVYELAWSPEGDRLVLGTWESSGSRSLVLELASGLSRPLSTNPFAIDHGFRWSPDGRHVALLRSWSGAAEELLLADPESGRETRLDDQPAPYPASWSADGRRIAYTSAASTARVRVREAATGALLQTIGAGDQAALDPRFDPSGRWLSFVQVEVDPLAEARRSLVAEDLATGARTEPVILDGSGGPPFLHEWSGERLAIAASSLAFYAAGSGFQFQAVRLAPGENLLVARAFDPGPGLWSPESETVRLTVAEGSFPDLTVSEVQAYPSVPIIGEPVRLSARLVNLGALEVTDVAMRLTLIAPGGSTVLDQTAIVSSVPAGGSVVVSAAWTPGAAGVYRLRAQADPDGSVVESNEGNNEASRDVVVAARPELVLSLRSDRPEYGARAPVLLDVRVMNGGPPFSGSLRTSVEDAAGQEVALLDSREVALEYGQDLRFDVGWNTSTTYAGDYAFRVRALEGESERASASQTFRILPEVALLSRLVPDRPSVAAGSPATFVARVENRGPNSPLDGATLRLRLRAEGLPDPIAFETERALPRLVPGAVFEGSLAWPQAGPTGRYTAELHVLSGARLVLSEATARLTVEPSVAVVGTLSLEPEAVLQGQGVVARLTLRHGGAGALTAYPVQVEVTSGPDATVLVRQTLLLDLPPAQTTSAGVTLQTTSLPPGRYAVRLRGGDPAATLARTLLTVHGPIAPPSLDAPASGAAVPTSHPLLRVNNAGSPEAAPLLYEFALFADTLLTEALPGATGVPETPGRTAWTVETRLGEDRTYYWRVRATDGFSRSPWTSVGSFTVDEIDLPPGSPVADSPLPGARVATRQPRLVVTNARDPEGRPLTYELRVANDASMTDVLSATSGLPEGSGQTAWLVPLLLEEDATYYWSARASDGPNFSPWSPPVSFQVDSDNLSPSAPIPLRPAADARVDTFSPALVVGNSEDPEDDPLTYRFQIDVTPTFDSPARQSSGEVTPGLSETTWTPAQPLAENTLYHWRAGAFDGRTFGPWAGSRFFVNTRNEAPGIPVPLDPVDGRTVGTPAPVLKLRNTTDPDGDVLTYAFEVRDEAGTVVASADTVPADLEETAWTVTGALAEDQRFTWSARASDGKMTGEWSVPASFRVNAVLEPPSAPTPQSPANGATVTSRRPALVAANATSPDGLPLTYAFELYAVAGDGSESLFDSASLVPETIGSTSWTPARDLPDGAYSWRARASDPGQAGPWSATVRFTVAVDVRPAPPTGLRAVPGDGLVTLTWDASPEPDVTGYRVYRAQASGGPYAAVALVPAPAFTDRGLANGVTVYYVVGALDARFESDPSAEVAATPVAAPPAVIPAEVRLRPASISAECLLSGECEDEPGDDAHDGSLGESVYAAGSPAPVRPLLECVVENGPASFTAFFGYQNESDSAVTIAVGSSNRFAPDPQGRGQTTRFAAGRSPHDRPAFAVDFSGGNLVWTLRGRTSTASPGSPRCPSPPPPREACPRWLYATVELPSGLDPATIDVHTVRILGVIAADPSYRAFVDRDGDGITEAELRFPFRDVRPSLGFGANSLALTGLAGGVEFRGIGALTVAPVAVNAWVTPRTLLRHQPGGDVQVRLTFRDPLRASDVVIGTVRLNGLVPVSRVVNAVGQELLLRFPRPAALGVLQTGAAVEVRVTGQVGRLPFTARDSIEVME